MRIQHNIAALNSYRQLSGNNSALSKNLEKLSSGYRINRAGDDAAGLAISEKMRAQIKGLEAAQKNANDGISLVQTAEGALTEVHSMLNRMVYLATQSANGTYDDETSRTNLQKEVDSLLEEIDRISKSTNFNGIDLLNGKMGATSGIEKGSNTTEAVAGELLAESAMSGAITKVENSAFPQGNAAVAEDKAYYMPSKFQVSGVATGTAKNTVTFDFELKDGEGGTNTFTVTLDGAVSTDATAAPATEYTLDDIIGVLNGTAKTGITVAATGTGNLVTAAATGKTVYTDKYEFGKDADGKFTIKVKDGNEGTDFGIETGIGNLTGVQADKDAIEAQIKEDYAQGGDTDADTDTGNKIEFGAETKTTHIGEDGAAEEYKLASATVTLNAVDKLHGQAIKIGDKTYVMKEKGSELSAEVKAKVDAGDWEAVEFDKSKATGDSNYAASNALALAINKTAKDTGIEAMATAGSSTELSIRETQAHANANLADKANAEMFKFEDIISAPTDKTDGTSAATSTTLSIDKTLKTGTQIKVGDKTFEFVSDPSKTENLDEGVIGVQFKEGDANANAQALADAIKTKANISTVTVVPPAADAGADAPVKIDFGKVMDTGESDKVELLTKGLVLQVGDTAASYQKVAVNIGDMSSKSLGIDDVDISKQESASAAIDKIKAAINKVSSTRGDLGAVQNRLEHTINNLGVTTENLTAAESRIRDTDMAEEMMNYTKNNILVQAAQAMLAQANTVPQGVLQLLQ